MQCGNKSGQEKQIYKHTGMIQNNTRLATVIVLIIWNSYIKWTLDLFNSFFKPKFLQHEKIGKRQLEKIMDRNTYKKWWLLLIRHLLKYCMFQLHASNMVYAYHYYYTCDSIGRFYLVKDDRKRLQNCYHLRLDHCKSSIKSWRWERVRGLGWVLLLPT